MQKELFGFDRSILYKDKKTLTHIQRESRNKYLTEEMLEMRRLYEEKSGEIGQNDLD